MPPLSTEIKNPACLSPPVPSEDTVGIPCRLARSRLGPTFRPGCGFFLQIGTTSPQSDLAFNIGIDFVAARPAAKTGDQKAFSTPFKGHLSAWDPIQQKEIWRVDRKNRANGGILSTAVILYFKDAQGNLESLSRQQRSRALVADAQSGVVAAR